MGPYRDQSRDQETIGTNGDLAWDQVGTYWNLWVPTDWDLLDPTWDLLDPTWDLLDPTWDLLDPTWDLLDPTWDLLDPTWDLSAPICKRFGAHWSLSERYVDIRFGTMRS
jgi:hypothetical protein